MNNEDTPNYHCRPDSEVNAQQPTPETPTPRTDAEARDVICLCDMGGHVSGMAGKKDPYGEWVESDFARQLERELAETRANNLRFHERLEAQLEDDSIVASCNCLTKTPDVRYHKPGCKYRLISERDDARQQLDKEKERADFAWQNTHEIDKVRMKAEADRDALRTRVAELVCLVTESLPFVELHNYCRRNDELVQRLRAAIDAARKGTT